MNYDRVILELIDRVAALEDEVSNLKQKCALLGKGAPSLDHQENDSEYQEEGYSSIGGMRDTTKYIFEGKRYGKNRLVLAVIQQYVEQNPNISAAMLMSTFDKTIQGSLGVVRTEKDAKNSYGDYKRRFFFQPDEIIRTSTDKCVVCTQWGKFNIGNFISRAEQLGMYIQTIGGASESSISYGEKMNSAFALSQLIGGDIFMELYGDELDSLHNNCTFMEFILLLRKKLNGSEINNTKAANTKIMNDFYYANINDTYPEVANIVAKVKRYGKQGSAHISIYYAMYVLDYQS